MPLFAQSVYEREASGIYSDWALCCFTTRNAGICQPIACAIITLKKPISWDKEEMVDVIFLLAFKLSTHDEIKRVQSFYQEFISLIETNEKISVIRNEKCIGTI